ncbi:hypothetical protein J3R83DRAFT_9104 [Lanmaoa asiatica]|nr:hypothetical protein J3R83DRAFT_9104 [Lanmaoa asiatica]
MSTMLLLTESTLSFVNLLVADYESTRKKSLSGTVKGWATLVHEKTLPKDSPGPRTTPSVSALSALSSQATKVDTPATTSTQYSVTDAGITTKFGSFDLDSEDGDNKEKEEMPFKNTEGKLNDDIALVVPSTPDSDVDEASQIPPWYSPRIPSNPNEIEVEASQILPSYSPCISSACKRKMEDIVPDSDPKGDKLVIPESNMQMDIDVTHETRTTALSTSYQTSVSVTIEDTQPVAKKAKIEAAKETQVETGTTAASMDTIGSKKTQTAGTEFKSRSDYKNSDLPVPADHRWANAFMDTAILWAGGQANVWSIPDETLAVALQEIFTAAWQRLLEWRSGFGSTALVMVVHFFWEIIKDDVALKDPSGLVREIAKQLISPPYFPFTHEDCDNMDPTRNFRSDFILKLIATAHLSKTVSAVDIQSLETGEAAKGSSSAFTLVRDGVIDVQNAVKEMAEKKGKITAAEDTQQGDWEYEQGHVHVFYGQLGQ